MVLFELLTLIFPEFLSKRPGACHLVWSFSANSYPFPLVVKQCNIFGPGIFFKSCKVFSSNKTLCPSMGPKYLNLVIQNSCFVLTWLILMPVQPSLQ